MAAVPSFTQLLIGAAWTDISAYVATAPGDTISIARGRQDEASAVQASTCTLKLNNRDGRFTPRNPAGPYYGKIGRNTPLRVRAPSTASSLLLPGGSTNSKATTPDTAALDIVGDIDLRAEFTLDSFAATACVLSKGHRTVDLAYELLVGFTAGVPHLTFRFSTTGTDEQFADHTIPELVAGVPIAVRVTLDVNDGGGNHTFAFYTAPSIAGPWTLHGATTTIAGTVTVASTAGVLSVGQDPAGSDQFIGNVRAVRVLNGIAGTTVANPDFNLQPAGTTSFADAAGRTWTVAAAASIGPEPVTRFTGEVAAWPQAWNDTGADVWCQVQAAGILRRLGQGQAPKQTGLKTFVTSKHFDQCWPGDTPLSLSYLHTPLVTDHCTPQVHYGLGDMGDGFPAGMLIDTTNLVTGNVYPTSGYISGYIGAGPGGTFEAAGFVFKAEGLGSMAFYLTAYGTLYPGGYVALFDAVGQTVTIYRIDYNPDVGFSVFLIHTWTGQQFYTDGALHSFLWVIRDTGSVVTHTAYIDGVEIGADVDGIYTDLQGMASFRLTYDPTTVGSGSPVAVSYLTFWSDQGGDQTLPDPVLWAQAADGYIGETAGRRIQRLCSENGIPFTSVGDLDDTARLGPQGTGDLVTTLQDAAGTDLGVLYEPRGQIGLTYRTRTSLYNQAAPLTLDYTAGVLGSAPDVTDDDQAIRNDMTVTRPGGGSARDFLAAGALSVLAPPNGIGTYSTSVTVNTETDGPLPDQASWRLALGTIDEARWPSLHLNVMNPAVHAVPALYAAVLAVDLGDLLTVTHLPGWLPPDDVGLLAQGYTETLTIGGWDLELNCSPASPYQVAVWATSSSVGSSRYDAENSTLVLGETSTATTFVSAVASAAATQPWTTDAAAFPFDINIGGERMTVTNITGASSPQTFTVVRSVNSVIKSHSAGELVRLWSTPRYAL